jgi:MFS family permease
MAESAAMEHLSREDGKNGSPAAILLRCRDFRLLWLGAFVMYGAIWMQSVGAAWVMAAMAASPLMVALMQTAVSLPALFFGLPGGVLADRVERRRYLLLIHAGLLATSVCLGVLMLRGELTPWRLLAITFAFGTGQALQAPAWHASQLSAAPPALLAKAVMLASIPYNIARALGPGLAGLLIVSHGPEAVFVIVAACLGLVLMLLAALRAVERQPGGAATTVVEDVREVYRHVRHSRHCRRLLARTALFVAAASGLIPLLPVLVRDRLPGSAISYGLLLACSAAGAVLGALAQPRLSRRWGVRAVIRGAILLCACATLGSAWAWQGPVLGGFLLVAGGAWLIVVNMQLAATQGAVTDRLRARMVAVFLLVYQGGQAGGSVFWGVLADRFGVAAALAGSAVALLGVLVVIGRFDEHGE